MPAGPSAEEARPYEEVAAAAKRAQDLAELRARLRARIRRYSNEATFEEKALMALVHMAVDQSERLCHRRARWTLRHLSTLVHAFETAEPPAATEPP